MNTGKPKLLDPMKNSIRIKHYRVPDALGIVGAPQAVGFWL